MFIYFGGSVVIAADSSVKMGLASCNSWRVIYYWRIIFRDNSFSTPYNNSYSSSLTYTPASPSHQFHYNGRHNGHRYRSYATSCLRERSSSRETRSHHNHHRARRLQRALRTIHNLAKVPPRGLYKPKHCTRRSTLRECRSRGQYVS